MEQECTCQNHVQCDIKPTLLTSQVVLPSYEHFLQHLQLTCMTKKISNETNVLNQYWQDYLNADSGQSEWLLQSIHTTDHNGRRDQNHAWRSFQPS